LRFIGQPFGMIHRPLPREVTNITSVAELLRRHGNAAYWTRLGGGFLGASFIASQTPTIAVSQLAGQLSA